MYSLKDVHYINFKTFLKSKELLTAYTSHENVPFNLKRIFLTGNVSKRSKRGSHAHKKTSQIFICLYGMINIRCFDGKKTELFKLTNQSLGIYIPPTIWYDTLYEGLNNSIMVLADKKYNLKDYILSKRDYLVFRKRNASIKYKN
tara:strand:+ start:950 stop:1384 length:435 start_codon:yes stop_codon:yes gene_type:complete